MNAVTSFVALASLLLALGTAGVVANKQTGVNSPAASRTITPSKLGVNHNETMVSDATTVHQRDTSNEVFKGEQAFGFVRVLLYPNMAGCPVWMCGSNHNETMVRDLAH
jgi:hypothetical protein